MRIYRSFHPGPLVIGTRIQLDEAESRHLSSVRRARVGDEAIVVNGEGIEVMARVVALGKQTTVELFRELRSQSRPVPTELACALTKSGAFDDMIQRAVELGMTAFRPIVTARTVVDLEEKRAEKKSERWRKLAAESLKQCERLWTLDVYIQSDFEGALAAAKAAGNVMVFLQERATDVPLLSEYIRGEASLGITIFIGPEGGWTESEIALAKQEGVAAVSLGSQAILRTETAALAALAVVGR